MLRHSNGPCVHSVPMLVYTLHRWQCCALLYVSVSYSSLRMSVEKPSKHFLGQYYATCNNFLRAAFTDTILTFLGLHNLMRKTHRGWASRMPKVGKVGLLQWAMFLPYAMPRLEFNPLKVWKWSEDFISVQILFRGKGVYITCYSTVAIFVLVLLQCKCNNTGLQCFLNE